MLMSVRGRTGIKKGKEMNVKYMNELPAGLKEHRETKTSKLLAVMQDFMARRAHHGGGVGGDFQQRNFRSCLRPQRDPVE